VPVFARCVCQFQLQVMSVVPGMLSVAQKTKVAVGSPEDTADARPTAIHSANLGLNTWTST
jgi:hypothetical protein